MSKLKQEELNDFIANGVNPDCVVKRPLYDNYKLQGLSHKEAFKKMIDDVYSIKSDSISDKELALIKEALLKVPGILD